MKKMTKLVAFLLALCMVISLTACGKEPTAFFDGTKNATNLDGLNNLSVENLSNENETEELTREELETIVDVIDPDIDTDKLTDKELSNLADSLLNGLDKDKDNGSVDVNENKDAYDENGAMTRPFDEVYPELIESGAVEFSDEALLVKMSNAKGGKVTSAMAKAGVVKLEEIVPLAKETWYKASLKKGTDAKAALEEIRTLKEILLAEYDYKIQTAAIDNYQDIDADFGFENNKHKKDQWYLHHCGIPASFNHMKYDGGQPNVIVAVIDTGVDIDHEDLAHNIWKNTKEKPGNGVDDDKNGYIDDYYGVNIVSGKGNGDDDNGHGTHVAGIIAARNNNIGTVGIAHKTTIMPVKAAMASGYLNQSDIAKAVLYAYENGAEVINMSFGGTACSIAVQDALATAYTRCVLVASAGNDGVPNEHPKLDSIPNYPAALTYVLGVMAVDKNGTETYFTNWDYKAFNGVEYELYAPGYDIMSTLPDDRYGSLSGTSMAAPVVSAMAAILRSEFADRDTYPTKFIYGQLTATSENYATCLDPNLHGVHNIPQIANLHTALTKLPKPDVGMQDFLAFDTEGLKEDAAKKNNGDGVVDAGETLSLGLILRNRWGMSKNTKVTLDTKSGAGISDPYITIVNPTVNYDSVGTYSTQDCGKLYTDELHTGWENPFIIKIAEDCPNDYIVKVNVTLKYENGLDEKDKTVYSSDAVFTFTVRNGVVLPSVIDEDMTLTPDNLYIIPNSTVIEGGVTVRVRPGTNIQFWSDDPKDPYADSYIAYLLVKGKFLVEGTKENPVNIFPSDLMDRYIVEISESTYGYVSLSYAEITNFASNYSGGSSSSYNKNKISYANHCTFRFNYSDRLLYRQLSGGKVLSTWFSGGYIGTFKSAENSTFYNIGLNDKITLSGNFDRCIFANCGIEFEGYHKNCVFLGNAAKVTSSMTPSVSYNLSSKVTVKYNTVSGNTYISTYMPLSKYQLDDLCASYAIINDKNELEYLCSNFTGTYDLGIKYDYSKNLYCWSDGSNLDEMIDTKGILSNSCGRKLSVCLSAKESYISDNYTQYHLYEIEGKFLPISITFSEYIVDIDDNATYQINPQTEPVQLGLKDFIYESNDESIIKVSSTGLVTPVGRGTADIYVYSRDRAVYNYVTFNVVDYVALDDYTFLYKGNSLGVGDTLLPTFSFTPSNTTRKNIQFTSSDTNVVRVDSGGNICGILPGTATITANCEGIIKRFNINVVTNSFDYNLAIGSSLDIGRYIDLSLKEDIVYTSSDETTLSVKDGIVSAISTGEATVTAKYNNTVLVEVNILAFNATTTLDLNRYAYNAYLDDEIVELPSVEITADSDVELCWSSSDKTVADIIDGKFLLYKAGYTLITVVDNLSGLSDSMVLYVSAAKMSAVKQLVIVSDSEYTTKYFLTEDNKLYSVSKFGDKPTLLYENVADFDVDESETSKVMVLLEDGNVAENCGDTQERLYTISDFNGMWQGEKIVGIEYCFGQRYAFSTSGRLWVWGNNDSNQLGSHYGSFVSTPTFFNSDLSEYIITDVIAVDYVTGFLTNESKLFVMGGEYERTAEPRLISKEINSVYLDNYNKRIIYESNYGIYYIDANDFSSCDNEIGSTDYYGGELWTVGRGFCYAYDIYRDVLIYKNGYKDYRYVESISGIVDMYCGEDEKLYVVTDNNLLYIVDKGTVESYFPVLSECEEGPIEIISTNLDENNILHEDTLYIYFNKHIVNFRTDIGVSKSGGVVLSGKEQIIPLTNYYAFKPNVWSETETYYFRIDKYYGPRGPFNSSLSASVEVQFTYSPSSKIDETESVVHESVLDVSINRILTAADVIARAEAIHKKYNINSTFNNNVILNNISTDTNVEHWLRLLAPSSSGAQLPLGQNYWGTTNETAIGLQLIDYADFISYGRFMYAPFLTEAPEDTFPFVTSVKIFNKHGEEVTTVGNEQITVRVTFNRDMDTSIPLQVRFGSAYPYGDYEIEGKYKDARTWEGKYKLSTIIEGGIQYFTIENGCSATDDLELMRDRARFAFEIDTTAAQALIMQGEAQDTGIKLSWTQDDFDTLMGYNVYRSTTKDGLYTRVNTSVIPADTMEFFDDTVEPGVLYYYNFTVVQTDLSESIPSGKIVIMSKDTMAPAIYHSPVYNATTGSNLIISATVTDNLNITYARVYYRIKGTDEWKVAVMNNLNDKYSAIVIADHVTTAGIEYYIEAFDGVSYTYKGSADAPYVISVQEVVSGDAMGDVNGDGAITNLDALMLLKATNDQLNLTAEQFARADLDGNGSLAAKEALCILQYVSGAIGSVDMRG